ncbi:MAG: endonuclease/exonuclease/phosphatase family protein [Treponema sp.]|jgi:endonuclease/exonuclease/phosphatase family metal-dependent hydrolase|nr:endonuclease/exonuclease/phosphatase family protein [Treponema sp.]
MKRCLPLSFVLLAEALLLGACSLLAEAEGVSPPGTLRVVTWNVQALFDGNQSGTEYSEYFNEAGWGSEKFSARVNGISQAIGRMAGGPPDILALEEIENLQCLEALASGELAKYGYGWTYFAKNRGASLGIGVLSRIPFTEARAHGMVWDQETAPRPVLELWLYPEDDPLALFVCHWKSKLGGDDATETLRRASARIILRRIREIRSAYPDVPAVIMGDLNENYDEFYRRGGTILSALLPDDPDASDLAGADYADLSRGGDFLLLSGEKPPAAANFDPSTPVFYSPWEQELQNGSYYYRNEWETIDHFLLSEEFFDQRGWDFSSCRVLAQEPFVSGGGIPDAYNPRTGSGLSDHLPLMLVLTRH